MSVTESTDTNGSIDGSDDFLQGYSMHDVAMEYAECRLSWYGMTVEAFGVDARHTDDPDTNYGRPDLLVQSPDGAASYIEVKAKSDADWMGVLDSWKFENYLDGDMDDEHYHGGDEESVWILFFQMDEANGVDVIRRESAYPVRSWNQIKEQFTVGGQTVCSFYDDEERLYEQMIQEIR